MALPTMPAAAPGGKLEIDREYFQTLLMLANVVPSYDPSDPTMVRISATEFDVLTHSVREYITLQENLLASGLPPATLLRYLQSRTTSVTDPQHTTEHHDASAAAASSYTRGSFGGFTAYGLNDQSHTGDTTQHPSSMPHELNASAAGFTPTSWASPIIPHSPDIPSLRVPNQLDSGNYTLYGLGDGNGTEVLEDEAALGRDNPRRVERRTLNMTGLSPDTTLKDVVDHVRGGMLLEIFRLNDRAARVSFFRGKDAEAFRAHSRRHDIYINNKRIEVDWSDRQFSPNFTTYSRVTRHGATRVLRLRDGANLLTEKMIRDDMDHIHNLVVLDIKVQETDLIIHTNSVQGCGYARNCMMSRMPYRLLRFAFDPDDCAEPLPQRTRPNFFNAIQPTFKLELKPKKSANLYDILRSEASEDDDGNEDARFPGWSESGHHESSSDICGPRSTESDAISYR